jgi:hypothetical protein
MARHNVIATEMMKYERKPKAGTDLGGGNFGRVATRKLTTRAMSPRLLKYRGCVAGKLQGQSYGTLGAVQSAFRDAAHACKMGGGK